MLREKLIDRGLGDNKKFRWRSHEVSRTEGLSDAVFGFAITLLVVSLEVPRTFGELMYAMRGFGAFAISFTLLLSSGSISTSSFGDTACKSRSRWCSTAFSCS